APARFPGRIVADLTRHWPRAASRPGAVRCLRGAAARERRNAGARSGAIPARLAALLRHAQRAGPAGGGVPGPGSLRPAGRRPLRTVARPGDAVAATVAGAMAGVCGREPRRGSVAALRPRLIGALVAAAAADDTTRL